ncbi:MAG: PilZ domain-containing protein [Candidatus Devosia phytovorans]|uniref:PilZ domain-containing protein n=1 Tax=Candidatus Devosia phytovorans TaxID=3121372 RepID=A0AAJ6AZX1_9HYPH|nr:PilZ domain-containing protein [Devosia sp.]WEK02918.1 MAG: PilZ domain-containing protein [Devosia sp.]
MYKPTMHERRTAERIPVDLWATIVSDDGLTRIDVNVLDLSHRGARIALDDEKSLPDDFYVLMPDNLMHDCELVWRDASGAGLRFAS